MSYEGFHGFPQACFEFLASLEQHNNREWFNGARKACEKQVFLPAQDFVGALGNALKQTYPKLVFDTRTNGMGSMFRLARDTRFSRDKSPYKTNLGFRFWLSEEARHAGRIGLYVHLDKSGVRVYGGAHQLAPEELGAFRIHVAKDRPAAHLRHILDELENRGYELEADRLARVPRGYAVNHANADLLVYKNLFAKSQKVPLDIAGKAALVDHCTAHAIALKPLNDWFSVALPLRSITADES